MDIEQTNLDPNPNPESAPADGRDAPKAEPPSDTPLRDSQEPTSTPQDDGSAGSPEPTQPAPVDQSAIENSKSEIVQDAPGAENGPETPQEGPQDPDAHSAAQNVPLAHFQGVQRRLATTEAALQTANARLEALNAQVAEAHQAAAAARIAEIRATHADIVPDLITGRTLAEVETSLQTSRRAFAAAQQAYARTIPTPSTGAGNPAQQPGQDQPSLSPLQMISAGLRQPKTDINR